MASEIEHMFFLLGQKMKLLGQKIKLMGQKITFSGTKKYLGWDRLSIFEITQTPV